MPPSPVARKPGVAAFLCLFVSLLPAAVSGGPRDRDDVLLADFEGETYGRWTAEGTAFGDGPAAGTLPGQMAVTGFAGKRLANSFHGGDGARGRLRSPEFTITRDYITFLVGGGGHPGKTCLNLIVSGKVVRTSSGGNVSPGGSERLERAGWDVCDLNGRTAHLEIVDAATGTWGHINVDDITLTDAKPPAGEAARTLKIEKRWLNIPIKNDAPDRVVTLRGSAGGENVRNFRARLADGTPDWWAFVDVGDWEGRELTVHVDRLPDGSSALAQVTNADAIAGEETLYREPLRPQFHFSAKRGWLNDPNGLVYANGEYQLFFQHCPFYWSGDGPKYWGRAVSRDLVHWTEVEEALAPDEHGAMWSGSAVVDWRNTSGLGSAGKSPVVLMYTAAGDPFVQCLASGGADGRFAKFRGNPVMGNITPGNRDPRVFWHEPTGRWVQALYVEEDRRHTVHILTSPNLRDWTPVSVVRGQEGSNYLYECPDLFPLPLDGDREDVRWVIMGADTQYTVGRFDGKTFTPETPVLPGHRGRGFYAPQTFNEEPKGRRVQIGWWQTETRGMPFNQSMSLPLELRLVTTPDGPRLTWTPVEELASLRARTHALGPVTVTDGGGDPLSGVRCGELVELRAAFTPGEAREVAFTMRGVPVVYDVAKQELVVNGHRATAPLIGGTQRLTIYADRTGLEVFASDDRVFVPMPINLNPGEVSLSVTARGGAARFDRLDAYELRSAWRR